MSGFTEFVPTAALRNRAKVWFAGLTRQFRTYKSLTVRGEAGASNSQISGLTGIPSEAHLARESCLAATLPPMPPQESGARLPRDPWKYGGLDLTEKQRQEAHQLAADRKLDLLVYGRPS